MKAIQMMESYPFFDTTLMGGAIYNVTQTVGGGHVLTELKCKQLIEEGWAKEVA